jgi:acyl dehydratase
VDVDLNTPGRFSLITDAGLDSLRRLIGVPIVDSLEPWCTEVSRDGVRHYAHGVGDDNPLWCDPAYAAGARHGRLAAPPSFVFALDRTISGYVAGLPGVHAMWAGSDFRWHHPFLVGQRTRAEAHLADLVEHETRFAGRAVQQIYHVDVIDQDDRLLCEGESWCFRTERDTARERGTKYDAVKEREAERYTAEDLEAIWAVYEQEQVRGPLPRLWEDVEVGEQLPRMAKGPMTVTGFIAFAQGWGGLYIRANRLAHRQLRAHPALGIPNAMGIPDVPERVHWDTDLAQLVGTPAAYDYGPERASWLMHHLTDWMGDDGSLRQHACEIRRHNPVGDTVFITGEVTAKRVGDDGRAVVEVTQRAVNQHDELSATGHGTVELPQRG